MATSNNMAVTTPEIPEWLKAQQDQNTSSSDTEALASLSNKIPRISLKGRKFRLIIDGEEIRKPSDELDVVILAVEPEKGRMVKTFYAKGYSSGDTEPPSCSSADGVRPDAWVQDPVHSNCAQCPKNAFGSATSQSGKPSKACRDSKRLWVAIPDDDAELKIGVGRTAFSLGVPVTSLSSLSEFGKTVAKNGYPLPAVIVKLEMVDAEFPQIAFSVKGFLDEERGRIAMERNVSRDWLSAVPAGPALENNSPHEKPVLISQSTEQTATSTSDVNVNKVVGDWGSN